MFLFAFGDIRLVILGLLKKSVNGLTLAEVNQKLKLARGAAGILNDLKSKGLIEEKEGRFFAKPKMEDENGKKDKKS